MYLLLYLLIEIPVLVLLVYHIIEFKQKKKQLEELTKDIPNFGDLLNINLKPYDDEQQ